MNLTLPGCETLRLELEGGILTATLDRPDSRNALNETMVGELSALADALIAAPLGTVRALVLRGAGDAFCAGGDIRDFRDLLAADEATIAARNRRFGALLERLDALPFVVIAVIEGPAFGGGLGLIAIADVVLATAHARFALSETGLGLPPAQIAPFVAGRIGLAQARRLALTGIRLDAGEARRIGLIDQLVDDDSNVDTALASILGAVRRTAPEATATTKALLLATRETPRRALLNEGADAFARALRGAEVGEGVAAFLARRAPSWADPDARGDE